MAAVRARGSGRAHLGDPRHDHRAAGPALPARDVRAARESHGQPLPAPPAPGHGDLCHHLARRTAARPDRDGAAGPAPRARHPTPAGAYALLAAPLGVVTGLVVEPILP